MEIEEFEVKKKSTWFVWLTLLIFSQRLFVSTIGIFFLWYLNFVFVNQNISTILLISTRSNDLNLNWFYWYFKHDQYIYYYSLKGSISSVNVDFNFDGNAVQKLLRKMIIWLIFVLNSFVEPNFNIYTLTSSYILYRHVVPTNLGYESFRHSHRTSESYNPDILYDIIEAYEAICVYLYYNLSLGTLWTFVNQIQ